MRTAIVYASVHHGNTEKLVKRIAEECQVDLIDAVKQPDADLSSYDMIGFASGIYFSKFHQSILEFAEKNLPDDKKIFLICTYGGSANYKTIEQILDKRHASVVGKFGCKGYDTFGPFKLVGGIAKDHPNEEDMKKRSGFRKRITLIFEQRKTGDFTPRFSGSCVSVFNLKNIFYRHFQVMCQPDCNLKRGITFSTFDAAYSLAAGTYGFSQICLNEIPFFTNIF